MTHQHQALPRNQPQLRVIKRRQQLSHVGRALEADESRDDDDAAQELVRTLRGHQITDGAAGQRDVALGAWDAAVVSKDDTEAHLAMILYRHTYIADPAPVRATSAGNPGDGVELITAEFCFSMESTMAGTLHFDGIVPTLEQEAPDVPNPMRAVEVFTERGALFLRVGPVEGLDAAHGSYTLKLSEAEAMGIVEAIGRALAAGSS